MEAQEIQEMGSGSIQKELRSRRVGSVTFGLTLILFGILFLVHIVAPGFHYEMIFSLWPVVFILLGLEILAENHRSNAGQCKFVYDFPAIVMLLMMMLFAMVMAVVDVGMENCQWWLY